MHDPIFTVVGHTTPTSTRIFFCGDPIGAKKCRAILAYRVDGGVPQSLEIDAAVVTLYATGVFDVTVTDADDGGSQLEYAVDVIPDGTAARNPEALLKGPGARTTRLLPRNRPIRFGLVSCNGFYTVADEKRRFAMWDRLTRVVDRGDIDMIIYAGDQVYADPIWMAHDNEVAKVDPKSKAKQEEIRRKYHEWYVRTWRHSQIANVHSTCPSVMMWDDHEIFDGYGSNDDDSKPAQRLFFEAAKDAFATFQASHGPPRLDQTDQQSFAWAFVEGTSAFVALDCRSRRNYGSGTILGDRQLRALGTWLEKAVTPAVRHLFITIGIPVVHAKIAAALAIMEGTFWTTEEATDDLRDQWIAENNRSELGHLLMTIFDRMKALPKLSVTILAGDVHVATIASIETRLASHRRADGSLPRIRQVVSSGIGFEPPSGLQAFLLKLATSGSIDLFSGDIIGRLLPLTGYPGVVLNQRNFAVIDPTGKSGTDLDKNGNLWVRFHAEEIASPIEQCLAGSGLF